MSSGSTDQMPAALQQGNIKIKGRNSLSTKRIAALSYNIPNLKQLIEINAIF